MRLLTSFDAHAVEVDGAFYNAGGLPVDYNHMTRYREHIPEVVMVLRTKRASAVGERWVRIDGPGVSVVPIFDPDTLLKGLLTLPSMLGQIIKAIRSCDRYYLKMPDATGTVVGFLLCLMRRGYAVEVVADSEKGILAAKRTMPLVRIYAPLFHLFTKFLVWRAHCATYVSQYLRRRYPNKSRSHEWVFSSAELKDYNIGSPRGPEFFRSDPFRIISIGRLAPEKGHILLIQAFAKVHERAARPVELHLVGEGVERPRLEEEAHRLGIVTSVCFRGYIKKGPGLFATLDQAHVFVMPSFIEGMGRALVEAMAKGMPCLGSNVGGIPELLDAGSLFAPDDPEAMAEKILEVMATSQRLAEMSRRNFEVSKAWWPESLRVVKQRFWKQVIDGCK